VSATSSKLFGAPRFGDVTFHRVQDGSVYPNVRCQPPGDDPGHYALTRA
jgi:hypothetical protein